MSLLTPLCLPPDLSLELRIILVGSWGGGRPEVRVHGVGAVGAVGIGQVCGGLDASVARGHTAILLLSHLPGTQAQSTRGSKGRWKGSASVDVMLSNC